jgi:hypothetical protein
VTLKVPDVGEVALLNFIRLQLNSLGRLRLFKNDVTPADSDTVGTYVEATFPGYAVQTTPSFTVASSVTGVAQITHPALTFLRSAGGSGDTIYGYYVTDAAGTTLYWAERDPSAPINMNVVGNSYAITLLFQLLSQF